MGSFCLHVKINHNNRIITIGFLHGQPLSNGRMRIRLILKVQYCSVIMEQHLT